MFETEVATLTECPQYDREMVDTVISKYCSVSTITTEKAVVKNVNGIIVTKRRSAILDSLYVAPKPVQVFGEIEMELYKTIF